MERDCFGKRARLWACNLSLSIALHGALLLLFCTQWQPPPVITPAMAPPAAMMIELSAIASAPPTPQVEVEEGPVQIESPPAAQPEPDPVEEPEPKPKPKPKVEKPKIAAPPKVVEKAPAEIADTQQDKRAPVAQQQTAAKTTSAPASLPAPAKTETKAEQLGRSSNLPNSQAQTWENELLAKLEKLKRYPGYAQRMKQEDIIYLKFALDRSGQLLDYRIEASRGYQLLDAEVRSLIQRATPFPPPPAEILGERIELMVPIEFVVRRI
ncbi:protein TonB [Pseudomonas cuatrocienegasensis]|uniref:Protein TonB n=1 Tax=Pseudomonas cuatrocienegasensis TaxID=543360 RepID=A0ABY1B9Z2_9PSED|nr:MULTISPECIES: energy transducer TonB [Pseudomonas]OEC35385.1 hypothetical protein A7D25_09720 [Pseudomonas sp. 21C1]SEQ34263.1 protein TonB [Pseudomonas cuatrocienegasensis]